MSQQQQILNYLSDGEWHCMANANFFMKDDRKRISELRDMGHVILSKPCDGRCRVKHNSRLLMRKLYVERKDYNQVQPRNFPLSRGTSKEIWSAKSDADTRADREENQTTRTQVLQTLW